MAKKKINKKSVLLKSLVAITLLSAMLLSNLLGLSNAEYFKTFAKDLDLEMAPDLNWEYYLYQSNSTTDGAHSPQNGVYSTSNSFTQTIIIGPNSSALRSTQTTVDNIVYNYNTTNKTYQTKELTSSLKTEDYGYAKDFYNTTTHTGKTIVYQIKIPVDEVGYYNLDFTLDFIDSATKIHSLSYDTAVGCEILNHNDGYVFGSKDKKLSLYERNNNKVFTYSYRVPLTNSDGSPNPNANVKFLESDSLYQWKTMTPSFEENVSLAFKVEQGDVDRGYVMWMWDFSGLTGPREYTLRFDNVSVTKTMNLDGTTDYRTDDPYFMFPQTEILNNQMLLSLKDSNDKWDTYENQGASYQGTGTGKVDNLTRGVNDNGKVSYSKGRGSFVTAANTNSLTMQAESLSYAYWDNNHFYSKADGATYSNPVSFRVPLKNVKANTTYKVTFDFSIARQGTYTVNAGNAEALHRQYFNHDMHVMYADFANILRNDGKEHLFQSYIYNGTKADGTVNANRTENYHLSDKGVGQLRYNDKLYQGKPLTKYDEVTRALSANFGINHTTSSSVNDTFSINEGTGDYSTSTRNFFNAIQHTEYNGQNAINWLTFYNTTFSFNIKDGQTIDDLYWVWALDAVMDASYYRIKIENVRIEEVVEFSTGLSNNGVKIAGNQIDLSHADNYKTDVDNSNGGVFASLRGRNGTGQNYQARGYALDLYLPYESGHKEHPENATEAQRIELNTKPWEEKVFMTEGNIYAPIIDATEFTVADTSNNSAYKIELAGWAVCDGGVARYVYSVDGGVTWHDMTFSGGNTANTETAEKGVNQFISGTTRYVKTTADDSSNLKYHNFEYYNTLSEYDSHYFIDFTEADGVNGDFTNWTLSADLSAYKNQANLDIIIAAVPADKPNSHCEILRIINFNQIRNYRTFAENIISDIRVTADHGGKKETVLNASYGFSTKTGDLLDTWNGENTVVFNNLNGVHCNLDASTGSPAARTSAGGYARRTSYSHAYEDIRVYYSNIPVYTQLKISGWAIVDGGIDKFVYSVDGGKTWIGDDAFESAKCTVTYDTGINIDKGHRTNWFDGETVTSNADLNQGLAANSVKSFNSYNDTDQDFTNKVTCDLSDYVGQMLDVIVAVKPVGSDVFCPLARVDNVAVYGEDGTFYSLVHRLVLDGRTNDDADHYAEGYIQFPGAIVKDRYDKYLTNIDQWGLTNVSFLGVKDALTGYAHTIFEPNNVNALNARAYNSTVNEVFSGGRIAIDGYVICKNGVNRYKFSLDGGQTWSVIGDTGVGSDIKLDYARCSDASFVSNDCRNGMFCCNVDDVDANNLGSIPNSIQKGATEGNKAFFDNSLEFQLPAIPAGETRELLVVAESNDENDAPSGKLFPVLKINLKFKNKTGGASQIGYSYTSNGITGAKYGWVQSGGVNGFNTNNGGSNAHTRFTIPVSEAGLYSLTANTKLELKNAAVKTQTRTASSGAYPFTFTGVDVNNSPVTYTEETYDHWIVYGGSFQFDKPSSGSNAYYGFKFGEVDTNGITMSVSETEYSVDASTGKVADGTKITVNYSWHVKNTSTDRPAIYNAIIGIYDTSAMAYGESDGWTFFESSARLPTEFVTNRTDTVDLDISGLTPGTYNIIFINCYDSENAGNWPIENVKAGQPYQILTQEIIITICDDADETITHAVIHDEGIADTNGKKLYYGDMSQHYALSQYENLAAQGIIEVYETFDAPYDTKAISVPVYVTEADVRRGYIVWDWNCEDLSSGCKYSLRVADIKLTKDNTTRYMTADANGNVSSNIIMALPSGAKAGETYTFSTTSFVDPMLGVTHEGLNISSDVKFDYQAAASYSNYTGSSMSIPKTVYVQGESIPISYVLTNSHQLCNDGADRPKNSPWIGVTKANSSGKDEYTSTSWAYASAPTSTSSPSSGTVAISTAGLPAGDYKIYFRDNAAEIYMNCDFGGVEGTQYDYRYNITDPITITIVEPGKTTTQSEIWNYTYNYHLMWWRDHGNAHPADDSYVTVNRLYFLGQTYSVSAKDLASNNSAVHDTYAPNSNGVSANNINNSQTQVTGNFKFYFFKNYNGLDDARRNNRLYATVDINVLPAAAQNAKVQIGGGTAQSAYGAYVYSKDITITQTDINNGYVSIPVNITGYAANTDLAFMTGNSTLTKKS